MKDGKQSKGARVVKAILFVGLPILITLILFIIGMVMTYADHSSAGAMFLAITGIFEIVAAVVQYKLIEHKERYTCPECGAKRELHREYLSTSEKVVTSYTTDSNGYRTTRHCTKYTHHYMDYYICPECGEERVEKKDIDGGEFVEYSDGRVLDKRKDIQEI